MPSAIQIVVMLAVRLASAGLLAGVVLGWLGLLVADGPGDVAVVCGGGYLLLALLLPAALLLASRSDRDGGTALAKQHGRAGAAGLLVAGALLGSVLATLLFMVAAFLIPATIGGEDSRAMAVAIREEVLWSRAGAVTAITVLVAPLLPLLPQSSKENEE